MHKVRPASFELEKLMGIEAYLTDVDGIGGSLRVNVEDFRVEEVSEAKIVPDGEYLILRLTKENWETHHLIRDLSRQLGIADMRIGIAGTKDKRAITTQLISIKGIDEGDLARVRLPRIELVPQGRCNKDMGLGDLHGNKFDITIRNIDIPADEADKRVKAVTSLVDEAGGVPNFFGYQRFGVKRPITHEVGRLLTRGDVEGAFMTYVARSYPWENEESRAVRDIVWKDRNFKEGINAYPLNLRYERTMMHHIVERPGDYIGAFRSLSTNLLKIFVHAYQSYLFNRILSARLLSGISLSEPVEGDVVCFMDKAGNPDVSKLEKVTPNSIKDIKYLMKRQRALITLPLPGKGFAYDEGVMGDIERKVMEEESVAPENFIIEAIPELTSPGLRRCILLRVNPQFTVGEGYVDARFFLPKGCYATTVLREYMKSSPLEMD